MTSVLFVCLGNICRSPTAEAVFRARAGEALRAVQPVDGTAKLSLFLPDGADVPDPYYGGPDGFTQVVDLIEAASDHWLAEFSAAR